MLRGTNGYWYLLSMLPIPIIVLARGSYLATSEFTNSLFSRRSSSENHKSFIFSPELTMRDEKENVTAGI